MFFCLVFCAVWWVHSKDAMVFDVSTKDELEATMAWSPLLSSPFPLFSSVSTFPYIPPLK